MKNILYSILTFFLVTNIASAQLMSDEDHRIMMNDFATNVNTVLMTECPQGMTIDQFKKAIVNGNITLSNIAKSSINTYAENLKTMHNNLKQQTV